jgi:sialic acid synthase SpsE
MYVIAEIGFNHGGDIALAEEMIAAAAEAGADAVKFQTFKADDIALPTSPHYKIIRCGEMDLAAHLHLKEAADKYNVDFLSTPFSKSGVDLLLEVGVPAIKVASMDCTNKYLLDYIAKTGKPIYLSTGMANLSELADTLDFLQHQKSGAVYLLHCISMYPAAEENLNREIIPLLKHLFNVPVGYSDHYPGTKACLAAAMLGAEIIETHFTLDASRKDGDHFHSVEPDALKALIADIHLFKKMQGNRFNIFNRADRPLAREYRRGLYTARKLDKGEVLEEQDLLMCRPPAELSPSDAHLLIGKVLRHDLAPQVAFEKKHVTSNQK